jgi:nucleotide-binding universal stress UspA family protein
MTSTGHTPVIVVGVSGSLASAGALRWAADEAGREHGELHVVRAWQTEPRAFYAHPASGPQDAARQHQLARDGLAATMRAVLGEDSAGDATTEVIEGMAERVLVELSAGADLLVLGSASGLTAGRSIGPVARGCLSRAHCPVVVVGPEGPPSREPDYLDRMTARLNDYRELLPAGAVPGPRPSEDSNWRSR